MNFVKVDKVQQRICLLRQLRIVFLSNFNFQISIELKVLFYLNRKIVSVLKESK